MKNKLIILGALLLCLPSKAELSVLVKVKPLHQYEHNGKKFIQGETDKAFVLSYKNIHPYRVLVIPSVDGVSAIDGKTATKDGGGYVVEGGATLEVKGWRTSLEEVRQFVFVTKEGGQTYVEQIGKGTANCGVISLRVVKEWQPPIVNTPAIFLQDFNDLQGQISDASLSGTVTTGVGVTISDGSIQTADIPVTLTSANISSSVLVSSGFDLGTKFGEAKESKAKEISFTRSEQVQEFTIYYASLSGLCELGVDLNIYPQAFASAKETETPFCKIP